MVRWLNKVIVAGQAKALFSTHNLFRVHSSILEGVPTKIN